ncbi:ABC transporter ATP-binding protein [Chloroflexus aggregans]|uniref:ABC transporter related n=1 Tax=Chloroflexus aggregans (strain MD-66 / DSM 9485) TaxID=326427 RepID=B8G8L3_CHLAD|nr:ABC transporter ATP-binding protein [Chloroflexus aggregans]ACL24275.1 ABC transporter related [Chloroflexus aggregans DSM 9485]
MQPQLHVDFRRQLGHLTLRMQLQVGPEILVLFGPSGAGKTQTLQAIAGLMTPDEGLIKLNETILFRRRPGERMINLPPRHRRIGYVFQQYALFPHMTALENVAFPLGRSNDARQHALALLEKMHLAHVAHRKPHELSGGQQQRVAIARALATNSPVILFDESFSALDQPVRDRLHADLRALQAERGLIVIYVTHNLNDAFAVGHRVAIVTEGHVEQVGPLTEVYRYPVSVQVARILGIRNLMQVQVIGQETDRVWLDWQGWRIEASSLAQSVAVGQMVHAFINPVEIRLVYPDRPSHRFTGCNLLPARIVGRHADRYLHQLIIAVGSSTLEVAYPYTAYAGLDTNVGSEVQISFRPESVVIIPERSTTQIASSETVGLATVAHRL